MRRVLLQIIRPIRLAGKLDHEPVRVVRLRGLGAVVAPAGGGPDVGRFCRRVDAGAAESEHVVAELFSGVETR